MIDEEIRQSLQEEFVLGIFWCFELDRKAQMDLILLARQGEVGRCEANAILWNLFSVWALNLDYQVFSNKTSSVVTVAHRRVAALGFGCSCFLAAVHFRLHLDAVAFGFGCSCSGWNCIWMQLQLDLDAVAFRWSCVLIAFAVVIAVRWNC